jgi:hypothetical protein
MFDPAVYESSSKCHKFVSVPKYQPITRYVCMGSGGNFLLIPNLGTGLHLCRRRIQNLKEFTQKYVIFVILFPIK